MITRTPGEGAYARLEREQRWVLRALPDGLTDPIEVTDRYLADSTLRVREMRSETEVVRKLGQKVRLNPASPDKVRLTNLYLSASEYALLATLPGTDLRKLRWHWPIGDDAFSVDQFTGHLDGLVLAEIELTAEDAPVGAPPLAVADVSDDDRFSGGQLAQLTRAGVLRLFNHVATLEYATAERRARRPSQGI